MRLWQQIKRVLRQPPDPTAGNSAAATIPEAGAGAPVAPVSTTPASTTPPSPAAAGTTAADTPPTPPAGGDPASPTEPGPAAAPAPIWTHPLVRAGALAWALIGLVVVLRGGAAVLDQLSLIVVPLVLALFPAALLSPLMRLLVGRGVPRALAALVVLLGSLGLLIGGGTLLGNQIAGEAPQIRASVTAGIAELDAYLQGGPFGLDPDVITGWLEEGQAQLITIGQQAAGTVATAVAEGLAGLLFGLVALFFYLKDGARIAAWLGRLFPTHLRADASTIGTQSWVTVGAYFRGQLLVALVDAVFIGIGLALLNVPLALPLTVLIFFGGLFPIVGAFVSGAVAVLVALTSEGGLTTALAVLAIVVVVQQIESNVLAPVVLGKATALHPLAVILALATGGIVLGILGAFLAVPVAASLARAVGHLRNRSEPAGPVSPAVPASAAGR